MTNKMALETKELPSLLFWFLISGIAIYAATRVLGKVNEQIKNVFK